MRDMYDMMSTEWQIQCAIGGCLAQESCLCLYEHIGRDRTPEKNSRGWAGGDCKDSGDLHLGKNGGEMDPAR